MRALLWKELRESAHKVAVGLAVVLLLHLLRQVEDFNSGFVDDLNGWAIAVGVLSAAVLAMEAVAGERSRGTLEFLLVRPTTPARVLAAKWLVGAAGLLLVCAAFWSMVYATPLSVPLWSGHAVQALHDVGWPAMVYAWFLPLLVLYTTVFAASTATDNPAEAVGLGGIVVLAVVLLSRVLASLTPGLSHGGTVGGDLLDVVIARQGQIVRAATRAAVVVRRSLLAASLAGVGLACAWWLLARGRQVSVGRRTLVVSGLVLVALLLTVPRLLPDGEQPLAPAGTLRLGVGADLRGLQVRGDVAYVLKRDTLLAVDVSAPAAPRLAGRAVHAAGWSLSGLTLVAGQVCAQGARRGTPSDSVGVLCFDLAAPLAPRPAGRLALGAEPGVAPPDVGTGPYAFRRSRQLVDTGAALVLGTVSHIRSALTSIVFDAAGRPRVGDELVLETYRYPDRVREGEYTYSRDFFVRQHQFALTAGADCVYLGTADGLRTVAVGPRGRLTPLASLDLGDRTSYLRFGGRVLRRQGDSLWVSRVWPREFLRVDVSDPAAPAVVEVQPAAARQALPWAAGFHYAVRGLAVRLYDPVRLYARRVPVLTLTDRPGRHGATRVVLRDGFGYTLFDDRFAVFELPPLDSAAPPPR